MISRVAIQCNSADETLVVLTITPEFESELPMKSTLAGTIRGPYCDRSRTLPAEFVLQPNDGTFIASIVDPCYSTDDLKMEYQLELRIEGCNGLAEEFETTVELKMK